MCECRANNGHCQSRTSTGSVVMKLAATQVVALECWVGIHSISLLYPISTISMRWHENIEHHMMIQHYTVCWWVVLIIVAAAYMMAGLLEAAFLVGM
jgi:hypothetical protein